MADVVTSAELAKTTQRALVVVFCGRAAEPYFGPPIRDPVEIAVSQVFGVAQNDLCIPTRGPKTTAEARQVAMYVIHISCGINLTDVGSIFGRDRTTVAHACALVEDRRDDPVFDRVLELLEWIVRELMARMGCFARIVRN
jgi:Bacterial dnaA protein helix-turn-helix